MARRHLTILTTKATGHPHLAILQLQEDCQEAPKGKEVPLVPRVHQGYQVLAPLMTNLAAQALEALQDCQDCLDCQVPLDCQTLQTQQLDL